MERKVKMGLSAMMIVAMTFSILGIVFLPIGIAAWVGNWDIEGEPIVFVAIFTGLGTVFLILGILSFIGTIAFSKYIERGVIIERKSNR